MHHKFTNQLINEKSPYLLQHAHNPVNWRAWNEESLELAQNQQKLILVSIGYASCHWCHVMEYESFENEEIAKFMNDHFVCIKVDREERPDVDQVYMDAVQITTGRGGWPLNCFALPDGRPFFGGTYFKPDEWMMVLNGLKIGFERTPQKFVDAAENISVGINSADAIPPLTFEQEFTADLVDKMLENRKSDFDNSWGGTQKSPKFPLPVSYEFLLHYSQLNPQDSEIQAHWQLTLDRMALGGIYDQLGGGFARYSVDERWQVPHFEKMLYDNAQLISLYAKAYAMTKSPLYRQVVIESIAFLKRELQHSNGAFYSSLDADSEGVEGKFYCWNYTEIEQILGKDTNVFCEYFNCSPKGNWEKTNVLWINSDTEKICQKYELEPSQLKNIIENGKIALLKTRNKRPRPRLDDKIISSWNGLMLKALTDAARYLEQPVYLQDAHRLAHFICHNLMDESGLLKRNYKDGTSYINGFLDDYATVIDGLIGLYEISFDEKYLQKAQKLCTYALAHFSDSKSPILYYTSDLDSKLVTRKTESMDNVIPSSNSIMANNIFKLGKLSGNNDFTDRSEAMLRLFAPKMLKHSAYYANWSILYWRLSAPHYECVISGREASEFGQIMQREFLPQVVFAGSTKESGLSILKNRWQTEKTLIYVCRNNTCKLPVNKPDVALSQFHKK